MVWQQRKAREKKILPGLLAAGRGPVEAGQDLFLAPREKKILSRPLPGRSDTPAGRLSGAQNDQKIHRKPLGIRHSGPQR